MFFPQDLTQKKDIWTNLLEGGLANSKPSDNKKKFGTPDTLCSGMAFYGNTNRKKTRSPISFLFTNVVWKSLRTKEKKPLQHNSKFLANKRLPS